MKELGKSRREKARDRERWQYGDERNLGFKVVGRVESRGSRDTPYPEIPQ
jgi:hypothetical protein